MHCFRCILLSFASLAEHPVEARQPTQCLADFVWPVVLPPDAQGCPACLHSFLHLAGEITFIGTSFEQRGLALGRELVGITQRRRILGCCLAMSALCCRLLCRQRRIAYHQRLILRPSRVMDQAGGLGCVLSVFEKGLQHLHMQHLLAERGQRAFDGLARDLMPEGHRRLIQSQHAATETFLQRRGSRTQDCFQEPAFASGGNDGGQFEEGTRSR